MVSLKGAKGADSFKILIAISSIALSPDEIRISDLTKLPESMWKAMAERRKKK